MLFNSGNGRVSQLHRQQENHVQEANRGGLPKRLRVLHVGKYYPPYRGGMESHLEALCGQLKQSVEVEVIVANDRPVTTVEVIDGVRVTRVARLCDLKSAPVCPELVARIRCTRADVIHIHLPNPTAVLAYLASGHRGRLVFTYHSDIVRQKLLRVAFKPFLRRALRRADAIVVSSPNYINSSVILPDYTERCRVIPFGIPVEHFQEHDHDETRRIRQTYGTRIVLGVGRLVYYKGFEYLIRAMELVQGQLLIVGNGPMREQLEQVAAECQVSDRVAFLTDVQDVRPYYHATDVFALSSVARSEAFGIVQLEAMACGKPVVNTDLDSGVTFVSQHGVSGLTVPPADPRALGEAINHLLDSPERRNELGRGARNRVADNFSLQMMGRRTLELYHEVMNTPSRL